VTCTLVNDKYEGRATGTLVIAKSTATVTLANLSQTYNGSPRPASATTSAAGGNNVNITYNGSPAAPTMAGTYNVMARLMNPNYEGSATGTLVIAKATAIVTLSNLNQTYDGSPRSATASTIAAGNNSVNITYNGAPVAPTAAGSYNVMAKLTNPNYEGSATGTLVIGKATSTTALTLSTSNAKAGDTVTLTAKVTSTASGALPSGKVTFKNGDKTFETVTLTNDKGVATATFSVTLPAGRPAFTAAYSGDANFAGSTGAPAADQRR
jgi:hypothetical protein